MFIKKYKGKFLLAVILFIASFTLTSAQFSVNNWYPICDIGGVPLSGDFQPDIYDPGARGEDVTYGATAGCSWLLPGFGDGTTPIQEFDYPTNNLVVMFWANTIVSLYGEANNFYVALIYRDSMDDEHTIWFEVNPIDYADMNECTGLPVLCRLWYKAFEVNLIDQDIVALSIHIQPKYVNIGYRLFDDIYIANLQEQPTPTVTPTTIPTQTPTATSTPVGCYTRYAEAVSDYWVDTAEWQMDPVENLSYATGHPDNAGADFYYDFLSGNGYGNGHIVMDFGDVRTTSVGAYFQIRTQNYQDVKYFFNQSGGWRTSTDGINWSGNNACAWFVGSGNWTDRTCTINARTFRYLDLYFEGAWFAQELPGAHGLIDSIYHTCDGATPTPTLTPTSTTTPTATITPTLSLTPTSTITPTSTFTPAMTVTPLPTYTPYPTSTPYPTPIATPFPTYPPPPTAFPWPTPVITPWPTPSVPTGTLYSDFYYELSYINKNCFWLLPRLGAPVRFDGLQICFDYYNFRLIAFGIEFPIYLLFAAMGVLIVWRVFIHTSG